MFSWKLGVRRWAQSCHKSDHSLKCVTKELLSLTSGFTTTDRHLSQERKGFCVAAVQEPTLSLWLKLWERCWKMQQWKLPFSYGIFESLFLQSKSTLRLIEQSSLMAKAKAWSCSRWERQPLLWPLPWPFMALSIAPSVVPFMVHVC